MRSMINFKRYFLANPVEEQVTTADVRGLGLVSGNPGGTNLDWATLNQAEADTRDQVMNQIKKTTHDDLHVNMQQKLADRKNLFVQNLVNSIKDRTNGNV